MSDNPLRRRKRKEPKTAAPTRATHWRDAQEAVASLGPAPTEADKKLLAARRVSSQTLIPQAGIGTPDAVIETLARLARRVASGILDPQRAHAINSICHTALAALRVKNDLAPGGVGTRGLGVVVKLRVQGEAGARIAAAATVVVAPAPRAVPAAAPVPVESSPEASASPAPAELIDAPRFAAVKPDPLFGEPGIVAPLPTEDASPEPPASPPPPPTDAEAAAALESAREALGVDSLPPDEIAAYWAAIAEARRQYQAEREREPLVVVEPRATQDPEGTPS